MIPLLPTSVNFGTVMLVAVVLIAGGGAAGYATGKAFTKADLLPEQVRLTTALSTANQQLDERDTSLKLLEQAATNAGIARQKAEAVADELRKKNNRIAANAKTIKASSCFDMVGKLIDGAVR